MNINRLLLIHAFIMFAAGLVLIILPGFIPAAAGISLTRDQYFLCYLLGAAELAMAYLSFFGSKSQSTQVLKLVTDTFIVFHAATALLEAYAFFQTSAGAVIAGNIILRAIVIILFVHYGYYRVYR